MTQWLASIETQMIDWFVASAFEPNMVYIVAACFMVATCFGFPLPEEFVIIALGLTAHIGSRPDLYPPPEGVYHSVHLVPAILVGWGSVLVGDSLVFSIGRYVGTHHGHRRWVQRILPEEKFLRVSSWMKRAGYWTAAIFRFTPGLRLPGFFCMGMFGVPMWKFLLLDGAAASISIPTQIYLLYRYGEPILTFISKMKTYVIGGAFLILLGGIGWAVWNRWRRPKAA